MMKLSELFKEAKDVSNTRGSRPRATQSRVFAKGLTNAPKPELALREQRNIPIIPTGPMNATDRVIPNQKSETSALQKLWNTNPTAATQALTAQAVTNVGKGKGKKNKSTQPTQPEPIVQDHSHISNSKSTEMPPPPMTTLPENTSATSTANTVETATKNHGYNPLHEAPKNSTKIQQLREFLSKHPYGTGASALAVMAAGTAVLATAKHKTKEQRRIEERAKFASDKIENKYPINLPMLYQGGLEVPQIRKAYKEYLESGEHKKTTFKDYLTTSLLLGGGSAAVTRLATGKLYSPMIGAGLGGAALGVGLEGIKHHQKNKHNKLMDKYRNSSASKKEKIIDDEMFEKLKWIIN